MFRSYCHLSDARSSSGEYSDVPPSAKRPGRVVHGPRRLTLATFNKRSRVLRAAHTDPSACP
jgi:hypothetical protein